MFSFKADNFYKAAAPLHFVSKLIGLTPFSIKREKEKFVARVSFFNFVCLLCSTASNIHSLARFMDFYIELSEYFDLYRASEILQTSTLFISYSFLFVIIFINWWTFFHRRSFALFLNIFHEVFDDFENMNTLISFSKHKKVVLITLAALKSCSVFNFILVCYFLMNKVKSVASVSFITMWIYLEVIVLCFIQFTFLMWSVKSRYVKINEILVENFLLENGKRSSRRNLTHIAKLHDKLVDVTDLINRFYGVPVRLIKFYLQTNFVVFYFFKIMLIMAVSFACIIICIFNVFKISMIFGNQAVYFTVNNMIGGIFYATILYGICHVGHFTTKEVSPMSKFKLNKTFEPKYSQLGFEDGKLSSQDC